MAEGERRWTKGMFEEEDWWAFWIGLFFVVLGLIAAATKLDLTGWIIGFPLWLDITNSLSAAHGELMAGIAAVIVSYIIFTAATCVGAYSMKWNVKKYFVAFTIIYWLTVILYILSRNAHVQATPLKAQDLGIWSISFGGAHYIIALVIGLILGNFLPGPQKDFLKRAARPEWFIKIAIVCLGTKLGLKGLEAAGETLGLILAGICATVAAYLLMWPLAYTVCRKLFNLSREWAATLSSGISICGVSASIATGGSIRARPIVPVMISSIIVIFAIVELVILPFLLVNIPFWVDDPMAAGASLGLTVKTDGADAASGAILDAQMRSVWEEKYGVSLPEGWITVSAVMTKIWIDMFIGIWAFVLAILWVYYIERRPGEKVEKMQIWWRFPKFVIGYFIAMFAIWGLGLGGILSQKDIVFGIDPVEGAMRHLFFMLTFTSIGLVTDFRELKKEGLGKIALAYAVILVAIIIPLGWFIAWLFHHGMLPPGVERP